MGGDGPVAGRFEIIGTLKSGPCCHSGNAFHRKAGARQDIGGKALRTPNGLEMSRPASS